MAVQTWKQNKVFFSYAEATPFTADTNCYFEGRGKMTLPEPDYQVFSDYGMLGSGEHGKKNEIQALFTPWSYTCQRLSEIAFLLSYFQGDPDSYAHVDPTGTAWVHELRHLPVRDRLLPTFSFQYGTGTNNYVVSGCVVNEFSVTLASGGNGVVEATFSGWGNRHSVTNGVIGALALGSMSTGENDFSAEPLVNYKSCNFYMANALESGLGKASVDFEGEDLGAEAATLTSLLNSVTITGNNGMTALDTIRAGGSGVVNDRTRNDRRYTLEFAMRKDTNIITPETLRLNDTQKSFELLFTGPDILADYPYGMDLFFPVVNIGAAPEDDASPVNQTYSTEVFEDNTGESFRAYFQSRINIGYNAAK